MLKCGKIFLKMKKIPQIFGKIYFQKERFCDFLKLFLVFEVKILPPINNSLITM
jgi:hypothetical protein